MDSSVIRTRLAQEQGTIYKDAPERLVLVYPSPYSVGMSSLGFQTIYRQINRWPQRVAERAFLPDDINAWQERKTLLVSYESQRPVGDFPVIAFSVAYEPEIAGLIQVLQAAGIPALAAERNHTHPLVLCGGPLTYCNALPLAPFADAILIGEADQSVDQVLQILSECTDREQLLETLANSVDSCFVPLIHEDRVPPIARCQPELLPAFAQIATPKTELTNMFLVEAVRGCSRNCSYCVMRRDQDSGMRIVPENAILRSIPPFAQRVGLVGAGVSDHPEILSIINTLVEQGREVGLSSLRPDRLSRELLEALHRAGGQTLTTALDAASQRLRDRIGRKVEEQHLVQAARLAHSIGFKRLKLYVMVGLPDETEEDVDELIRFTLELSQIHPLSLAVSAFVPKHNTPLSDAPFAGIEILEDRLSRLRKGIDRRVNIKPTSARWAWVEYMLAQGTRVEGEAVLRAVNAGGRFSDWKRALLEHSPDMVIDK